MFHRPVQMSAFRTLESLLNAKFENTFLGSAEMRGPFLRANFEQEHNLQDVVLVDWRFRLEAQNTSQQTHFPGTHQPSASRKQGIAGRVSRIPEKH